MNCYYHPTRPAVAQCVDCHKGLCRSCAQKYTFPICEECNNKRRGDNLSHYIRPFIFCIILFIAGYNIEIFAPNQGFGAYMLMCTYGGWKAVNQFAPMTFVWFTFEAIFGHFLIKLAISIFLGFFIIPVYLMYCLYKIVRLIIKR